MCATQRERRARGRPYTVLPNILVLAHRSTDYSFPSDHAVMAGAVAGGLFLVNRRLSAIAIVAAPLTMTARAGGLPCRRSGRAPHGRRVCTLILRDMVLVPVVAFANDSRVCRRSTPRAGEVQS